MVFSSIPVYLDPPNWHQQQNNRHTLASTTENPQLPPLPPLPPPPPLSHVSGPGSCPSAGGSIRPGSMADRARLAKIPQPEAALKCPRCDSANTKFCYFNNYSLTQPRHFCKMCRRYWTRGGALRNVPVGGGCRRNKKSSKSSKGSSKSSATSSASADQTSKQSGNTAGSNSNPSTVICPSSRSESTEMIGHFSQNPQAHHHPSFMASIQNLAQFSGHGSLGLNFGEIQGVQAHDHRSNLGFQIGSGNSSSDQSGVILQGEHHQSDQWRLQQQFPLLGGHDFESSSTANLYTFHHENIEAQSANNDTMVGMMLSGGSRVSQFPPVKLEGRQGLNLSSRLSLGISENNNHFWAGNSAASWTDLSGLNSSTSHLL